MKPINLNKELTPQDYMDEYVAYYKELYGKDIDVSYNRGWYLIGTTTNVRLKEFKQMTDVLFNRFMESINSTKERFEDC